MRSYALAFVGLVACWQTSPKALGPNGPPSRQPHATTASVDRDYLTVWGDSRTPSPRGNHQLFAARMRADGTIVDPQGIGVDIRPHRGRPLPRIEATPTGWWIAQDFSESPPSAPARPSWTVWAQRVGGKGSVGAPIQASDVLTDSIDFDLAAAGDDALVAWAGIRRTKTEAARIVGDQKVAITLPANTGRRPALTFDMVTDSYVLAYREATAATILVLDRQGNVRNTLSIPGPSPPVNDGVRLAPTGTGEVVACWLESDDRTVSAVRIDVASAQITARATLLVAQGRVIRQSIVHGPRGFVFSWLEQGPRGPVFSATMLDGSDPFALPRALSVFVSRPDEMPQVQAGARGFLVTWQVTGEPYAMRLDADGNVLDAAPISLRGVRDEPVPTATLHANLDVVAPSGADYCAQTGSDRSVPGTVRGLYVVEGAQPWGTLYIPGYGWGGSTGSRPRHNFYVGRGAELVPHWKARPGAANPFELTVEIPDQKRKHTERILIESDDGAMSSAAGVAGPLDLVEFEANGGLGGHGLHFVITKSRVIEDARVLAPRFTSARAEFDKLVKATKKDIERVLAEAKRRALAANPHPTKGAVAKTELVVYLPTSRPTTGHIEVLFAYRRTEGVMMKFPPQKPRPRGGRDADLFRHPGFDGPIQNPRPVTWSVMMGGRFTLDGDKIVKQDVWAPSVIGADNRAVPWQCTAPQGQQQAPVAQCAGSAPGRDDTCVQNCGPPVSTGNDPPPGWSWLSPAQVKSRREHGCPICLPGAARVATPDGTVTIDSLQIGERILTLDERGRRIPATVLYAGSTLASSTHRIVRVELADGRVVAGSPGHPHASGKMLGELREGDALDGSRVSRIERVPLPGDRTWDVLPSGPTGLYIIDGVVLRSSFAKP